MRFDIPEFTNIVKKFTENRGYTNDITIDYEGIADVDPLFLLRAYEQAPTADIEAQLAERFFMGKHLKFLKGNGVIYEFTYQGGSISEHFKDHIYLLDVLLKAAWGLLIKKLTAPSDGSPSDAEKQE